MAQPTSNAASPAPPSTPPTTTKKKRNVAIIGGGVSGLSAAWHLHTNCSSTHTVHLFESDDRLGGHAHTLHIDNKEVNVDVDIGFMVYNNGNYPNMIRWFDALGVKEEDSDMSLSVSLDGGKTVEWNSDGLAGILANKSQLFRPSFYRFIKDMVRFNSEAPSLLELDKDDPRKFVTMGQYLRDHGYSDAFATHYLLPMIAAIWSANVEDVLVFPAEQLIRFFHNHRLLQIFDRSQWKTVSNRSQSYTTKIHSLLGPNHVHTSTPIVSIESRPPNGHPWYELYTTDHKSVGVFDDVIFACHAPTAASILSHNNNNNKTTKNNNDVATPELLQVLKNIEYADNDIYVHSDPTLMPKRKVAWASWNCIGKSDLLSMDAQKVHAHENMGAMEGGESGFGAHFTAPYAASAATATSENGTTTQKKEDINEQDDSSTNHRMKAVYVTYWLNRLQNLNTSTDVFVSLNPHTKPNPALVHERLTMAHPQFTQSTIEARQTLFDKYQGQNGLWFCGAWSGYGFHEDGCRSGFEVATEMTKVPLPWVKKKGQEQGENDESCKDVLVLPSPDFATTTKTSTMYNIFHSLYHTLTYTLPVTICRRSILSFLNVAIQRGKLQLKLTDGSVVSFGDGVNGSNNKEGSDDSDPPVTIRIFDDWFFVKMATEYDLGFARSYMAGHFIVEPLPSPSQYDPIIRPPNSQNECNTIIGDPIGLTRLFLLLIANRDIQHKPSKSSKAHTLANTLTNASGLILSKVGMILNALRYKLFMNNTERGGSLKNIHAHYDLSNDLFTTFLDRETLMYSSAIYDAVVKPPPSLTSGGRGVEGQLVFRGTLEDAQWRKLNTLLDRAQIQPGMTILDIGFGWGGLSLLAAKKYNCTVIGITLSVEQKALAESRVQKEGLSHLITFEVIDYRTFARNPTNHGKFHRILSCEMIEAVGHDHLGEFFWTIERLLRNDGIFVMEAITCPEARYETYRRSTDFINTIIFPGGLCPSLHALMDAAYHNSSLTLHNIDKIGLHYAETLREWRRRFNSNTKFVRNTLGFDDVFMRVWNYYMTYCEAGFQSQTIDCLILVFARPSCKMLLPLCETRSVTQLGGLTEGEVEHWLKEDGGKKENK